MYPPLYTSKIPINPFADPTDTIQQTLAVRRNTLRDEASFSTNDKETPPQIKLEAWAEQLDLAKNLISRKDLIAWLGSYGRGSRIPHHTLLNLAECLRITSERQNRHQASGAYTLAAESPEKHGPWKIWLRHNLDSDNQALLSLCENLDTHATTQQILKQGAQSLTVQTELNGQKIILKRHRASSSKKKLCEGLFGSRGLKAWQAAHALEATGIPTPPPIAALERRDGLNMIESFYIYEALPNAQSARSWIKPKLHQQDEATRHQVRRHLHSMLEALYASGIYHPDTKTGNLLVQHAEDNAQRAFYWIDLDGLRINCRPSPYRVLRNLIQLNGSLGRKLPKEERVRFLKDLSSRYPWLMQRWVSHYIEKVTRKRLQREVARICGH